VSFVARSSGLFNLTTGNRFRYTSIQRFDPLPMKNIALLLAVTVLAAALSPYALAQKRRRRVLKRKAVAAATAPQDLAPILAKFRAVRMPFPKAGLSARELKMVNKLVAAARSIEQIYWRQVDPEGYTLYESLEGKSDARSAALRRLLMINGSRFDFTDENKPFVPDAEFSPDRGFYPRGLTRQQIEAYVAAHPKKKAEIYSPYTVVRWQGDELVGVPYHVAYHDFLAPAARDLREAAALSPDPAFAKFLRARAAALLSDDYYPSDLLWVDLSGGKFDTVFAPYEVYNDDILGVKTTYEADVLRRDAAASASLDKFKRYVPDLQEALPLPSADLPSKRGQPTPMEVVDDVFRAGDLRHGYQAVADNLPNDPRIHQEKGTKKIFFKNFMDARVNTVIIPLAKQVMVPAQAAMVSGDGYLDGTLMHEISHGLGPAWSRVNGKQVDIRETMGPVYSALEEAKADAVGMYCLKWLVDKGVLPASRLNGYYASYVADFFRTVRFGVGEAHGQAEMMEFNYLSEKRAIVRRRDGRYSVDFAKMPAAIAALARELLQQEATGDRARAEAWFRRYDSMPSGLQSALQNVKNVPVDIDPVFAFPEHTP